MTGRVLLPGVRLTWMKSTKVHGMLESSCPMSFENRFKTLPEARRGGNIKLYKWNLEQSADSGTFQRR